MSLDSSPWSLKHFEREFDLFVGRERLPEPDTVALVFPWAMSRMDDPYRDVHRTPEIPNLWWGVIPGSLHPDGRVITGSYFILEHEHVVRFNSFALLSPPFI